MRKALGGDQILSPRSATVWHAFSCLELLDPSLPTFISAYWLSLSLNNTESIAVHHVCINLVWDDRKGS